MEENRDRHAVVTNAIKSLEMGGSFNQMDRSKFVQAARGYGIEDSVIEEIIDIIQTISLIHIHHYEYRLDASDLARNEKKAVSAELQKSIDENLEALKKISIILLLLPFPLGFHHSKLLQKITNI